SFASPGDYVVVDICEQSVFVILGDDFKLRAFYNVCRHRAHELLQGQGNVASAIVCPYHAWTYKKDGSLRHARNTADLANFCLKDYGLKSIQLEEFVGCVFVNLDAKAQRLSDAVADLETDIRSRVPFLDDLRVPMANTFGPTTIEAGWKVVVDNYVECYHCEHAHPDFASLICMDDYQMETFGLWSRQIGPNIRHKNSAYDVTRGQGYQRALFWYLWPNTTFNILPGADEMNVSAVRPRSLTRSSFEGHTLSIDNKQNTARSIYTAEVLVPEDISLCESVQRGLKSHSYDQGRIVADKQLSGISEHALHHFHRLVYQALQTTS
ncbi:MAG: aromatic ring-hydroxylating dioxygenase subunit alpha, partial [Pseudomonadales bacterium]|nr:aromatic ring-hydroxylating dioxygenase subunit alpha [Pseudomonadales bacterium]